MEIEIQKKEHRPLLKRTEVMARIAFSGPTPTKKEAVAAVSKAMGAKRELVMVHKVATIYGSQAAMVSAHVYEDRASLESLEGAGTIKKNTFEEKKAAEKKEGGEQ